ncbi:DNA-protecting protein DprA [bacterium]|nr:DNA-protecting protein DprA [bacterium]
MNLTLETQTVLLLCGRLGDDNHNQPLSLSEYNALSGWLNERDMKPSELLEISTIGKYAELPVSGITPDRLQDLLNRGGELALSVESWLSSGFWIISREDDAYPDRAIETLERKAPLLLFGAGDQNLLNTPGIAVVGSRNIDQDGEEFAFQFGESCARNELTIISGGARGSDSWTMRGALENGGEVIGVLAGDLARNSAVPELRDMLETGRLTMITLRKPDTPFSVGGAMERNKMIYGLAQAAVIVSSEENKGGTWAGADENHRHWRVPLFVRDADIPGNRSMIRMGWGSEFPNAALENPTILLEKTAEQIDYGQQESIFD